MNIVKKLAKRTLSSPLLSPVRNRLSAYIDTQIREPILQSLRLTRAGDARINDIHILGFPKSGHTWMQYLLSALVFGLDVESAPHDLVQDLIVDADRKQFYKRYLNPTYFKSHKLPENRFKKVVYLMRDGRDASLSYYHHLKVTNPDEYTLRQAFLNEGIHPCTWAYHVESWLSNPYGADIFIMRYEKLHKEGYVQMQNLCEFLEISRTPEQIQLALSKSAFDKMRSREDRIGWGERDKIWKNGNRVIRKGKVGSYLDEIDPSLIEEFNQKFGSTLLKCGYLI